MAFDIYPDVNTSAILGKPSFSPLALEPDEATRTFVELAQHVGPDPAVGNVATTFIRIAISSMEDPSALRPTVELLAHDPSSAGGPPQQEIDPTTATSIAAAVPLLDGVNSTSAALAYYSPDARDNVYLLKVAIEIPGSRLWLRITNRNSVSCGYVWIVADSDEDSRQPWLHVSSESFTGSPPAIALDAYIGQSADLNATPLTIANLGSGDATVTYSEPQLPAPYVLKGLPITVPANSQATGNVTIGADAPTAPGDIAPAVFRLVTRDKSDPGPFGDGHNDKFNLSAHVGPNDVWIPKRPMITGRAVLGAATGANGLIYAMGGIDGAGVVATVEAYDPASDRWSKRTGMTTARAELGVAAASNGKIYAVGGASSEVPVNPLQLVEEYDPLKDQWTTRATMPTARKGVALAAAGDGKLYAVGGLEGPGIVEQYDPLRDQWARRASLLEPRDGFALAAGPNGKLYAVGGFSHEGNGPTSTVEEYDPASDTWVKKSPMLTRRVGLALIAGRNGKLYAIGGNAALLTLATSEEYDPASDSWRSRADMNIGRASFGLATANSGRLYAMGGSGGTGQVFNSVEEFTP